MKVAAKCVKILVSIKDFKRYTMAKKKKNSNYVTEKRIAMAAEKEQAIRAKKRNAIIKIVAIVLAVIVGTASLIVGAGFIFGWWGYRPVATDHAAIEVEGYGTIHIELYGNDAPVTVANFKKLAESGYYNGTNFHRIIEDFMAQGGDGKGTATIKGEFSANGFDNKILHERGILSMARGGDNVSGFDTGSDQFFIVHKTSPTWTVSMPHSARLQTEWISSTKYAPMQSPPTITAASLQASVQSSSR